MPRKPWATKEQTTFLEERVERFRKCKSADRQAYTDFWEETNNAWFNHWPEHESVFPGLPKANFTEDQRKAVQVAIEARVSVSY